MKQLLRSFFGHFLSKATNLDTIGVVVVDLSIVEWIIYQRERFGYTCRAHVTHIFLGAAKFEEESILIDVEEAFSQRPYP